MDCWVMVDIVHSSSSFIHMANDLCEKCHSCTQNNKFPFLWKLYSKDCGCIGIQYFQCWFEVWFQSCFKFHLFTNLYFFLPTFSSILCFFPLLTSSFGLSSLAFSLLLVLTHFFFPHVKSTFGRPLLWLGFSPHTFIFH